jgi:hypothetical protein
MWKKSQWIKLFFVLVALSFPVAGTSQEKLNAPEAKGKITGSGPAVLWRSPEDIASRNLLYGSGGAQDQPHPTFTFLKEDLDGTSAKFDVLGQDEVKWKVKLGAEARSETVASRFLWAVGYFTDEDYFVSNTRVEEMPRNLKRGQRLVEPGGVLHNVRFEREPKGKKLETWQWRHNPFTGTRELNGLRIMMALINNWDVKNQNNAVYSMSSDGDAPEGSQQIYEISDLGASFGAPGFAWPKSKSRDNLEQYSRSKFITKVTPDYVDFKAPARPALMYSLGLTDFFMRLRLRWIGRHVPRADAKWMGQLLAQLSPDQIRDAFRAAGYSAQEVDGFAKVIEARIAELNKL